MTRPSRALPSLATIALICVALAAVLVSTASAHDGKGDTGGGAGGAGQGETSIDSLDDLDGLPCATGTDDPGVVQLEYGPPTQAVATYCQVGPPTLTISIDRMTVPGSGSGLALTGGEVVAQPPTTVCDSADLDEGERSCAPIVYEEGTVVTLTVRPDALSRFAGWVESAGTCRGLQNPCTVTMDRTRRVSATFGLPIDAT